MFQRYAQNIDPENEHFLAFISNCLEENGVRNPRAILYSELYKQIKEAIRDLPTSARFEQKAEQGGREISVTGKWEKSSS